MRFLILGAGAVGQLYGGFLHRAGHNVTFLTRPERLAEFQERGMTLVPEAGQQGSPLVISDARFIDHLESMDGFDCVYICVRAEQREEALATFKPFDCSRKSVIITFPAWRPALDAWRVVFGNCHYMYPGIMALYRGRAVAYKLGKTKIAPLFHIPVRESEALCATMQKAGFPAKTDRALSRKFQTIIAMGFPVLAAISRHQYNPKPFAHDAPLVRLAAQGAKEGLAALKASGEPLSGMGHAVRMMPSFLIAVSLSWIAAGLSGFVREMLEVHFTKIHRQTILLLNELAALPGANRAAHPAIDELLRRAG